MNNLFKYIGFVSLVFFSFFYTNKISYVIKQNDDLMSEIKEKSQNYYKPPTDVIINNDEVIAGLSGKSVDISKSYNNMKKLNSFNDTLLIYNKIKPDSSIKDIYDKYIKGYNKTLKNISIIFIIEDDKNINNILKILNNHNVKANFFVTSSWITKNNELTSKLIKEGHIIGYNMNDNYSNSDINWMNMIISKVNNQKYNFCYNINKDINKLNLCKSNKSYTILPILTKNSLNDTKLNLSNGVILAYDYDNFLEKELDLIIGFIKSRGFNILPLKNLIDE